MKPEEKTLTPEDKFIEKLLLVKKHENLSLVKIGAIIGLNEAPTSKLLCRKRKLTFNEAVLFSQAFNIPLI